MIIKFDESMSFYILQYWKIQYVLHLNKIYLNYIAIIAIYAEKRKKYIKQDYNNYIK